MLIALLLYTYLIVNIINIFKVYYTAQYRKRKSVCVFNTVYRQWYVEKFIFFHIYDVYKAICNKFLLLLP